MIEVRSRDDLERTFAAFRADRPDAVLVASDTFFLGNAERLVEMALAQKVPRVQHDPAADQGRDPGELWRDLTAVARRAATYVQRILKGEKPGDLPVELPSKFELVINMRTANALGISIPQAVIARADEVIR